MTSYQSKPVFAIKVKSDYSDRRTYCIQPYHFEYFSRGDLSGVVIYDEKDNVVTKLYGAQLAESFGNALASGPRTTKDGGQYFIGVY
jgi:hypothetical protein